MSWIITRVAGPLPPLIATAITLPIVNILMIYLVMPQVTRLLAPWLYRD